MTSLRQTTALDKLLFCCRRNYAAPDLDTETHLAGKNRRTSFVGTVEYMAPEVIDGTGYAGTCDWWTLGILLYEMLHGDTPFKGNDEMDTFVNITVDTPLAFSSKSGVKLSLACRQLLSMLLHKDMGKRLQKPNEIKNHPFFKGVNWALIRSTAPPMVPKLRGSQDMSHHYEFTEADEELEEGQEPARPVTEDEADFSAFKYVRVSDDNHWEDVSAPRTRHSSITSVVIDIV